MNKPKYITPRQLAARWNISPNTLRNWRVSGKGPKFVRFGNSIKNSVRYPISEVEKYEKSLQKAAN